VDEDRAQHDCRADRQWNQNGKLGDSRHLRPAPAIGEYGDNTCMTVVGAGDWLQ
jgi:hypothetical protein